MIPGVKFSYPEIESASLKPAASSRNVRARAGHQLDLRVRPSRLVLIDDGGGSCPTRLRMFFTTTWCGTFTPDFWLVCQAAERGLPSGGKSLLTESSNLIWAATREISKRILSWFRSEHKRGSSLSSISCFNRSSRSLLLSTKDRTSRRVGLRTGHQCWPQSWIVTPRSGFPQFQLLRVGLKRFAN